MLLGKSLKPRCFKNINLNKYSIEWKANITAWMNVRLFSEWLSNLNASMKKQNRKIILFLDNAPCHPIDMDLTHVKLQYFPPNTTAKLQPLDQGIIKTFKTLYRKRLVKHIITCCATAKSANDIKITYLDAVHWVDIAWKAVTSTTVRNTFRAAGFMDQRSTDTAVTATNTTTSSTNSEASNELTVSSMDDEKFEELKILNDLLQHVSIDGQTMNATDFINIDTDVPVFNEWNDNCEYLIDCDMVELDVIGDDESEEDDPVPTETPPKIIDALEMIRNLHLLATVQQPQLHSLINELECKLIDVYIDSKGKRQTILENFFKKN